MFLNELKKILIKQQVLIIGIVVLIFSIQTFDFNLTYTKQELNFAKEIINQTIGMNEAEIGELLNSYAAKIGETDITTLQNKYLNGDLDYSVFRDKLVNASYTSGVLTTLQEHHAFATSKPQDIGLIISYQWSNFLHFTPSLIFIFMLIVISSRVFTSDYTTNTNKLFLTTKNGKCKLYFTRIVAISLIAITFMLLLNLIYYFMYLNRIGLFNGGALTIGLFAEVERIWSTTVDIMNISLNQTWLLFVALRCLTAVSIVTITAIISIKTKRVIDTIFWSSLITFFLIYLPNITIRTPLFRYIPNLKFLLNPYMYWTFLGSDTMINGIPVIFIHATAIILLTMLLVCIGKKLYINQKSFIKLGITKKIIPLILIIVLTSGCQPSKLTSFNSDNFNRSFNGMQSITKIDNTLVISQDDLKVANQEQSFMLEYNPFLTSIYFDINNSYRVIGSTNDSVIVTRNFMAAFEVDINRGEWEHLIGQINAEEEYSRTVFFGVETIINDMTNEEIFNRTAYFVDPYLIYFDEYQINVFDTNQKQNVWKHQTEITAWEIAVDDNNLYYTNLAFDIIKVDLQTHEEIIISEGIANMFTVTNNKIYYVNVFDNYLYQMDIDGNNAEVAIKDNVTQFMLNDNYIYYNVNNVELYQYDITTNENKYLVSNVYDVYDIEGYPLIVFSNDGGIYFLEDGELTPVLK